MGGNGGRLIIRSNLTTGGSGDTPKHALGSEQFESAKRQMRLNFRARAIECSKRPWYRNALYLLLKTSIEPEEGGIRLGIPNVEFPGELP